MNKIFSALALTSILITMSCTSKNIITEPINLTRSDKPKILVLYNKSGGGHYAAAIVLKELLEPKYNITLTDFSHKIVSKSELISRISAGFFHADYFYNLAIKNNWFGVINFYARNFSNGLLKRNHKRLVKLLKKEIQTEQPDLIISVIPIFNSVISEAAQNANIPLIVSTTEWDLRYWVMGLKDHKNSRMFFTIGDEFLKSQTELLDQNIPESQIFTTGLPIKSNFTKKLDKNFWRNEFKIPNDKFVAMILLGGAGSKRMVDISKKLSELGPSVAIIACMGRNDSLEPELAKIEKTSGVQIVRVGFTDKIAEYMSASDVLITKPGPGSIYEAVHLRLPIILDTPKVLMDQESQYPKEVESKNLGLIAKSLDDIKWLTRDVALNKNLRNSLINSAQRLELRSYITQMPILVEKILRNLL